MGRLEEDLILHGPDAFVFVALETYDGIDAVSSAYLRRRERWWALHLHALDQHQGYNLEAGGLRSPASLFRDHERKLMRSRVPKYALLPGMSLQAPIADNILSTWHRERAQRWGEKDEFA